VYGLCKSDTGYPKSLEGGVDFFFLPENLKAKGRNDGVIKQWETHSQLNVDRINKNTYCLEILTVLWSFFWSFGHIFTFHLPCCVPQFVCFPFEWSAYEGMLLALGFSFNF